MEDRRSFFKRVIGMLGFAAVLAKGREAFAKKLAIKLDKIPGVAKVGGSVVVELAGSKVMLLRRSKDQILGISPICSHRQCELKYNAKTTHMDCSCHGSSFDLSGKALKGPATKSIKTYPAVLDGDRVIVTVE